MKIVNEKIVLHAKGNLFNKIPERIKKEIFEVLVERPGLSI